MKTNIKKNLKEVRVFLGLSQGALAKKAGFEPSAISHFETGTREPNLQNLVKLSKALGVSTDRLLFGVTDEK